MSNGAMMSHRIGRELSQRIAAIAPVVGAVFGDETAPARPVSALMINGLLDESAPANGGPPGGRDKPSTAMQATEVPWAFFKAHPKSG